MVGLDGGEWSIIDHLISADRMPNTASLINSGCRAELQSTMPPVSPLAWNSIYTGVNPGKHGVYDFSTFEEDYSRRSINSRDRKATPFWKIMNDNNVTTGLFKLPFSYPVPEVNGFFVSGFPMPGSGSESVYPQHLRETIGEPSELLENSHLISEGKLEQLRENLLNIISRQTDALFSCIENDDVDFLMTVYDGSDRIQHFFWKYMDSSHSRYDPSKFQDAIYKYYEKFDQELGRIIEKVPDDVNIILISDHGFGPLETDINIEYWLSSNGYIEWEDDSRVSSQNRSVTGTVISSLWSIIKKAGLDGFFQSIIPEKIYVAGKSTSAVKKTNYNWDDTITFFSTISGQSLYINLESKFQEGSVAYENYDYIVDQLIGELRSLKHPETDKKVLDTVVRADEVYHGWATFDSPDIILNATDGHAIVGGPDDNFLSESTQYGRDRSGDHTTSGIFVAHGPAFKQGVSEITELSVIDILPALLYLNGSPVPNHIDGSVPSEIFSKEFFDSREVSRTNEYGQSESDGHEWTRDEAQELEKNLQDLGYLE